MAHAHKIWPPCITARNQMLTSWASIENFPGGGQKLRKNLSDFFTRNRSENMFNLLHFRMFSTFLSTYHTYYHKNMLSHKFWRGQREHFSNLVHQCEEFTNRPPPLWTPMDVVTIFISLALQNFCYADEK